MQNNHITILLDITNYIANNTKHYYYVILIMLDLSSAFDTINHSILFAKLKSLGINRNISLLMKSYLTNRTFSIINDNNFTNTMISEFLKDAYYVLYSSPSTY